MNLSPFSKTYGSTTVLDFPGLELTPGAICGIIGSNGSGKSTLAGILAGTLPADQKTAVLDSAVTVGYMPQKSYAFRMSVRSNLLLNGRDPRQAEALLEALHLSHLAEKRADRLSGGETARMALARLMMRSYDLVILDEPTAAMDMETTVLAEQCICDYVRQTGCALILITHSLRQARRISHDICFFHKGRLLEHGPRTQLLQSPATAELQQFLEFYGA